MIQLNGDMVYKKTETYCFSNTILMMSKEHDYNYVTAHINSSHNK